MAASRAVLLPRVKPKRRQDVRPVAHQREGARAGASPRPSGDTPPPSSSPLDTPGCSDAGGPLVPCPATPTTPKHGSGMTHLATPAPREKRERKPCGVSGGGPVGSGAASGVSQSPRGMSLSLVGHGERGAHAHGVATATEDAAMATVETTKEMFRSEGTTAVRAAVKVRALAQTD